MPAWGTVVEFGANLKATHEAALPADLRDRVLLHPYTKIPDEDPVPISWAAVRAAVATSGSLSVWCPLRVQAVPDAGIPGVEYHPGDVPQWVGEPVPPPPDPDQPYVDLLKTTGAAFLAALRDQRWPVFVERFKSLDQDAIDSRPAYRGASEILERLMDIIRL